MANPESDKVKLKVKVKKPGRKRRIAGWTLLLLGLVVAGLWAASRNQYLKIRTASPTHIALTCGQLELDHTAADESREAFIQQRRLELKNNPSPYQGQVTWEHTWDKEASQTDEDLAYFREIRRRKAVVGGLDWRLFRYEYLKRKTRYSICIQVGLWPIPLLLWTPAALLLRSGYLARRRANTGACAKCGYSLAGLAADSPCPECGKGKDS